MRGKQFDRRLVLAAAAVCGFMAGITYVWSIYKIPLMEAHGWSSNEVTLAYSLFGILMLVGTFLGGPLQKRVKPRTIVMAGGLLQGIGLVLTGLASTPAALYFCYSLVTGAGNGIIYSAAVSAATRWFPDKRGFANGLCIGCMGLAPAFFAPLGEALIAHFDVSAAFAVLGALTGAVLLVASFFIASPDPGWHPAGWKPAAGEAATSRAWSVREMLASPLFWTLWVTFALAISSGLMMTSQASAIGQLMAPIGPQEGSILVMALAVASFGGRLCLGSLSDRIGRFPTLAGAMAVCAIDLLVFFGSAHTFGMFLAAMFVVGFCFGGTMAVLPNVSSDRFGIERFPVNYPFLFSAYSVAGFVGPLLASNAVERTGTYEPAFVLAGIMSAVAAVAFALLQRRVHDVSHVRRSRRPQRSQR